MGARFTACAEILAILTRSHESPLVDAVRLTLHRHARYVPDVIAVFRDGAVRRKLAAASSIQDRHPCPGFPVSPRSTHRFLAAHVGGVIGQNKERVLVTQRIDQRPEDRKST